jgi:hypothetical protein
VIAGHSASDPLSPGFLAALAFIALTGMGGVAIGWRGRRRANAARARARNTPANDPEDTPVLVGL